jgi:hypothetical protein
MFVNEEENECVGERDGKKENNIMTNDDIKKIMQCEYVLEECTNTILGEPNTASETNKQASKQTNHTLFYTRLTP